MSDPAASEPDFSDENETPDLCGAFLDVLPVTGASVTVITASGTPLSLGATDAIAARIDELQFELGEGPQWLAARTGEIASIPNVTAQHHHWPVLGAALGELPVGAVFSVPIQMGAVLIGVATLYCTSPRMLTRDQEETARALANAIAGPAARQALHSATSESSRESATAPALRREVHQATGMLLVQLNTSATVAYARLQAYAFANGKTVQAVAHDVVSGVLTFDDSAS